MSENTTTPTQDEITTALSEEDAHENPLLALAVEPDNDFKNMLVGYVGEKFDEEKVTVNMIAETLASEFPEFTFAFAEENFLRGYQLGLDDAHKTFAKPTEEAPSAE